MSAKLPPNTAVRISNNSNQFGHSSRLSSCDSIVKPDDDEVNAGLANTDIPNVEKLASIDETENGGNDGSSLQ